LRQAKGIGVDSWVEQLGCPTQTYHQAQKYQNQQEYQRKIKQQYQNQQE